MRKYVLAALTFVTIFALHLFWSKWFPEQDPAQARWVALPAQDVDWVAKYLEAGEYWLGYAFALSGGFAVIALSNLIEARKKNCTSAAEGGLAAGSLTLTGALALGGCFLVGCCGSPMLAVWLSIFGASFLPFAKPLVAFLTTLTIAFAWIWMIRRNRRPAGSNTSCCNGSSLSTQ